MGKRRMWRKRTKGDAWDLERVRSGQVETGETIGERARRSQRNQEPAILSWELHLLRHRKENRKTEETEERERETAIFGEQRETEKAFLDFFEKEEVSIIVWS